ncbi:MAG TPA: VOC family protein [Novosphingobium sp.]|nr:VOC family protein [Novosphingobium sp.]
MARGIRPSAVNHMNIVLEDFDASVAHFEAVFGAVFLQDIPRETFHAGLIDIGGAMYELFVPGEFLLISRYGAHYLGIEYAADMDHVRKVIADMGIRIVRDIGIAVHTHPEDTLGMSFEFYSDPWAERVWPTSGRKLGKPDYWRDQPGGMAGQKAYTLAVHDLEAATRFILTFFDTEQSYEEDRPHIAARARGFRVGDSDIELLAATEAGGLADHLRRYGQGIRSTVYHVKDVDQTRAFLQERGIEVIDGSSPGGIAIPAHANLGVMFEFVA